MNDFNSQPARHQTNQKNFEENLQSTKAFRRAHVPDTGNRYPPSTHIKHEELQNILPNLVKISYLLNLIQERSTVLLPTNWQN